MQRSLLCADIDFSTSCVDSLADQFEGVHWVLGNHTDELTPWVPLITRQLAIRQLQRLIQEQQHVDYSQQDQFCVSIPVPIDESEDRVKERANATMQNAGIDVAVLQKGLVARTGMDSHTNSLLAEMPRYWVLPCCLWDIGPDSQPIKFIGHDISLGRYHTCVRMPPHSVFSTHADAHRLCFLLVAHI